MWRSCLLSLLISSLGGNCSIIVERLQPVKDEQDGTVADEGTAPFNSSLQDITCGVEVCALDCSQALETCLTSCQQSEMPTTGREGMATERDCRGGDSCCTRWNLCFEGEGDCDRDNQCYGNLRCGENKRDNNCRGRGFDSTDDCCFRPRGGGGRRCRGGDNCCTRGRPCRVGEGDCDNHDQCVGNLRCGSNNCRGRGFDSTDDCCYRPGGGNRGGGRPATGGWRPAGWRPAGWRPGGGGRRHPINEINNINIVTTNTNNIGSVNTRTDISNIFFSKK